MLQASLGYRIGSCTKQKQKSATKNQYCCHMAHLIQTQLFVSACFLLSVCVCACMCMREYVLVHMYVVCVCEYMCM